MSVLRFEILYDRDFLKDVRGLPPRDHLEAICAAAGDRGGFFQFLALTGLRHAEARALRRSDYDLQHHLLRFSGKKGGKPRRRTASSWQRFLCFASNETWKKA